MRVIWFTREWFGNYLPLTESSTLKAHSNPQRVAVRRQQTGYAKCFPCLECRIVSTWLYQSGILNRSTGNAVAEYASNFLVSPFILVDHPSPHASKTDDSDLSESSRLRFEMLAMGRWSRASSTVFGECQISVPKERTGYCAHYSSDVCPVRDSAHFLKKIIDMTWHDTV